MLWENFYVLNKISCITKVTNMQKALRKMRNAHLQITYKLFLYAAWLVQPENSLSLKE